MPKLIFLFLLFYSEFLQAQDNAALINTVFTAYQNAVVNDKGMEAVRYLDSISMNYFKKILENVKHADSVKMESLSLPEKFNVLMVRHLSTKKEILALTPGKLAAFNYANGWGGKDKLQDATLGKLKIKNQSASAFLVNEGKKTETSYNFNFENKEWKINITPFINDSEKEIGDMIQGQNPNEFMFGMLELMTGKAPTRAIWKPIK